MLGLQSPHSSPEVENARLGVDADIATGHAFLNESLHLSAVPKRTIATLGQIIFLIHPGSWKRTVATFESDHHHHTVG
jgi:hypothetical protein